MRNLLLVCLLTVSASAAFADTTVTPNFADNRGVWQGWGTSLAWWGEGVGQSQYQDTLADLIFTQKNVAILGRTVPGLGLNIARFNIGGCGQPGDVPGLTENDPSTLPWYKAVGGYWLNWFSSDPTGASYDWTRDPNQRAMMKAAYDRGATIEMFANAPEWWMTAEKSSCGGQLQWWNRNDFASYLATVVHTATTQWGIPVQSIEAFNEPSAGWWKYPQGQEGCNIYGDVQAEILGDLRTQLDSRGLRSVKIAASDENAMSTGVATYNYLKSASTTANGRPVMAANLIDQVNIHSYNGLSAWTDNSVRTQLHDAAAGKTIWSSEFGDPDGGGMTLAQLIMNDLNYLRSSAWIYWQVVEPYSGWGLVNAQYGAASDQFSPTRGMPQWLYTKYYMFAQFTRFLRPGMTVYGTNDPNTVCAYNPVARQIAFVTVNYNTPQKITYDLSALPPTHGLATVTETTASSSVVFKSVHARVIGNRMTDTVHANGTSSVTITDVSLK